MDKKKEREREWGGEGTDEKIDIWKVREGGNIQLEKGKMERGRKEERENAE